MEYDKVTPNSRKKRHYYLAVVIVVYVRSTEENTELRQRTVNIILESSERLIHMSLIEQARRGAIHRIKNDLEDPDIPIKEVIIQNLIHMGLMSPEEMQGQVAS